MSERFFDDDLQKKLSKFSSDELFWELKQRYDNFIYYFLNSPHRHDSDEYHESQMDFGGECHVTQRGMFEELKQEFQFNHLEYEFEDEYDDE